MKLNTESNTGAESTINYSIKVSKCFNYKTSITGKLENNNVDKKVEIAVPLKYRSNFQRTLHVPLINCEVSLILTWSKNCVIKSQATKDADLDTDPETAGINNPTNAVFTITETTLY